MSLDPRPFVIVINVFTRLLMLPWSWPIDHHVESLVKVKDEGEKVRTLMAAVLIDKVDKISWLAWRNRVPSVWVSSPFAQQQRAH